MPHIVIEHTANLSCLPFETMLSAVTSELADSPEVFDEADLKARVLHVEAFRVGLEDQDRAFIHVTVRILAGRSTSQKKKTSANVLCAACCGTCQPYPPTWWHTSVLRLWTWTLEATVKSSCHDRNRHPTCGRPAEPVDNGGQAGSGPMPKMTHQAIGTEPADVCNDFVADSLLRCHLGVGMVKILE